MNLQNQPTCRFLAGGCDFPKNACEKKPGFSCVVFRKASPWPAPWPCRPNGFQIGGDWHHVGLLWILLGGLRGPRVDLDSSELGLAANFACFFIFQRLACFPKREPGRGGPGWAACTAVGVSLVALWRPVKPPSSPPTRSSDVGLPTGWGEVHII